MVKKIYSMFLYVIALFMLVGCATQDASKTINPYAFKKNDAAALESMYRYKSLGKLVLYTDWSFGSKGFVVVNNFAIGGRVNVGYLGGKEAVEIYLPESSYDLILNPQEKKSLMMVVSVKSGETTYLKWSDVSVPPAYAEDAPLEIKKVGVGALYYMHEISSFISKIEKEKKPDVDFSVKKIGNFSANLRVFLYNQELIEKVKINGEEVSHPGRNLVIEINKELKTGENRFDLEAVTYGGATINKTLYVRKYTEQEERNRVAEEKRIRADAERQEKQKIAAEVRARKVEEERISKDGDGTPDDLMCKRYGLKPQTTSYAECRMKLDFARTENARQQQQYEREQAEYERRVAEIQKEREKQRAMRQLELGLRMMGGQSPVDAVNSVGTGAPIAPSRPSPVTQTITLPNGRMVNCTTFGTNTNCF